MRVPSSGLAYGPKWTIFKGNIPETTSNRYTMTIHQKIISGKKNSAGVPFWVRPFHLSTRTLGETGIKSGIPLTKPHIPVLWQNILTRHSVKPDIIWPFLQDSMPMEQADKLIENVIGRTAFPVQLIELKMNGKSWPVPLASLFTPFSAPEKLFGLIAATEGITAMATSSVMMGQIQLLRPPSASFEQLRRTIRAMKTELLRADRLIVPRLVERGGGLRSLELKQLSQDMAVLNLYLDVKDAMGANLINTLAEGLAPLIARGTGWKTGVRILSNSASLRTAGAEIIIPFSTCQSYGIEPSTLMTWIRRLAAADSCLTAEINTRIMTGVNSLVTATGNDWRAMDAAAHKFAARKGAYQPLAQWRISGQALCGRLKFPVAVGTVGRTRQLAAANAALEMLGNPSSPQLAMLIASVGLAASLEIVLGLVSFKETAIVFSKNPGKISRQNVQELPSTKDGSIHQRRSLWADAIGFSPDKLSILDNSLLNPEKDLPDTHCRGSYPLPVGIVPNVMINGRCYHPLYTVEEPSIGAAMAYGAKLCTKAGGIKTRTTVSEGIAQVSLTVTIPPHVLKRTNWTGEQILEGVLMTSRFAELDPDRAVTHNKGIMNGMDPVALTLGADIAAISAQCHFMASQTGTCRPLITWAKTSEGNLEGKGTLPIPLAALTVPSSLPLASLPLAALAEEALGNPELVEKAELIAAMGLLANLPALIALGTVGIQQGHMKLHERSKL